MKTIEEALKALASGDTTSLTLAEECLTHIEEREADVGAYLEVFDDVRVQAEAADKARKEGGTGQLLGIPIALKDNILMKGRVSSAGSKMLENYVASYDATAVEKLKQEGAVFIGRTNMDEFAMGSTGENSAFHKTKNPAHGNRVPGGSSGGSAAAVAYGGALGALGSDTGGSVRQPGSFCGVVGLKPTYGTVSRSGLIAMGSSLDVIGPLTQSVSDAELLYKVIKGKDPLDMTSTDGEKEIQEVKTIGVPRSFLSKGADEDVLTAFGKTVEHLEEEGYTVKDIELPLVEQALSAYYIVMPAEASSNLSRFDGVRYGLHKESDTLLGDYTETRGEGFGPEVKRRILTGTYVLSSGYYDAYYVKAQALRQALKKSFDAAFEDVDVIVTPTSPTPAFELGEKSDPLSMYLADIFTVPANLTGIPALSVPSGTVVRDGTDLPIGFQIMAQKFCEEALFSIGKKIEEGHNV